ncbi:hypothetical protein DASB73_030730 [Starmerella bacillaris]|uniref:RNA helicase n=1 Tax=Starmerella bacillaris TaxID=1247836 RepID=A0AAV5RL10_STABA|nr:hypothetical protein DASB73_030730 [Starmerella bacillaris]
MIEFESEIRSNGITNLSNDKDFVSNGSSTTQSAEYRSRNSDASSKFFSLLYQYLNDVSHQELIEVSDLILELAQDSTLTDAVRKREIDELLGTVSGSEYDEIKYAAASVLLAQNDSINTADTTTAMELDVNELPDAMAAENTRLNFIDLNEPIRIRNQTVVRPEDITANWIQEKLNKTLINGVPASNTILLSDILEVLSNSDELTVEEKLISTLGLENIEVVNLFASNKDVIYWYHLLSCAESQDDRAEILEEINKRHLTYEEIRELDNMNADLPNILDLNSIGRPSVFIDSGKIKMPTGTTRFNTSTYEQYDIPGVQPGQFAKDELKDVLKLPEYLQDVFKTINIPFLNIAQSRVSEGVVNSDKNVLVCAPTGAGKTNMALMAISKCLQSNKRAVYIAPMKALAQELVASFGKALPNFVVQEVSGDEQLSFSILSKSDVLVATPEKWDVLTRKPTNHEFVTTVGLLVLDEVHLLNDENRGGILEAIVVRNKRFVNPARLMALSATLPNYKEVAQFINASEESTYYFDNSYRPVALNQSIISVTAKQTFKQRKHIDGALVDKVSESLDKSKQILIFVQSRRGTEITKQLILNSDKVSLSHNEIGIHHAGLPKTQREETEKEFKSGKLRIIVCTATLAWGVNLPASVVIVKDTQFYDPLDDEWKQIKPQDIIQMLGRAGRPGFDVEGHGIILTTQKYLPYFANVATSCLPAQSYLIQKVSDYINAEIVLGSIRTVDDAVDWIKQTFWHIRANSDMKEFFDAGYGKHSVIDIAHSALVYLSRYEAVHYEYPNVRATYKGILASNFYVSPESISAYSRQLKPWLSEIDLLRIFSRSAEFKKLHNRPSELIEIQRLSSFCPIPLRDSLETSNAKICVLLQAYISQLSLNGLALATDMVYVAQSASRLFRAIFELCLVLQWGKLAKLAHQFYMMVDLRIWFSGQSPFRQIADCPNIIIKKAERCLVPFSRLFDLSVEDLNKVMSLNKVDNDRALALKTNHFLKHYPRVDIIAEPKPLTDHLFQLVMKFTLICETKDIGSYILLIFNLDGSLLHKLRLSSKDISECNVEGIFTEFLLQAPYPDYIFVHLVSEKWLHSITERAVDLRQVYPPQTHIGMDIDESSIDDKLEEKKNIESTLNISKKSVVQRAILPLLESAKNIFLGLPRYCDQIIASNQIIEHSKVANMKTVIIGNEELVLGNESSSLTCYYSYTEIDQLARSSRRIKELNADIFICMDIQEMSSSEGFKYELAITNIKRYSNARLVAVGFPLASANSLRKWLGISKSGIANFPLSAGVTGPSLEIRSYNGSNILSFLSLNLSKSEKTLIVIPQDELHSKHTLLHELQINGFYNVHVFVHDVDELMNSKFQDFSNVVISAAESLIDCSPFNRLFGYVSLAKASAYVFTDDCDLFARVFTEPLPSESRATGFVADVLVPGIYEEIVNSPQEAVNWLSGTFLYQRLLENPSYYGVRDLQDYVSEIIESAFEYLDLKGIITMDPETLFVKPKLAAHTLVEYGITVDQFTKPISISSVNSLEDSARLKYLNVVDAKISYAQLTDELISLLKLIDQRQAIVQKLNLNESPLLQVPHFTEESLQRCRDNKIYSIQDFVSLDDDEVRNTILGFNYEDSRMTDVANFANNFPLVDIAEVKYDDDRKELNVLIERDMDPDDDICVVAPGVNPDVNKITESWYVIICDQDKYLLGLKKIEIVSTEVRLTFSNIDRPSIVWLLCDSYMEADKEYNLNSTLNA